MAFRKIETENRRIQLVSLIDLIFILLIFFIITSILIKVTRGEARLYVPLPKNEAGEAQLLIQILGPDSFLWLDHTAIDTLYTYGRRLKLRPSPESKINLLLARMVVDSRGLNDRIERLALEAGRQRQKTYFAVIRCPEEQPYYYATDIIQKLAPVPNVEYGCVAGSIEDLKRGSNIKLEANVLTIDF